MRYSEGMTTKPLTAKQEAFAQAVADGMTQSAAYRLAYNAEKMAPKTVVEKASILINKGNVRARVDELKSKLAAVSEAEALWTRRDSVMVLANIARQAEKEGDSVRAVSELNKMHGWHAPEKLDHTSSDGSMSPQSAIDASQLPTDVLKAIMDAKRPNN